MIACNGKQNILYHSRLIHVFRSFGAKPDLYPIRVELARTANGCNFYRTAAVHEYFVNAKIANCSGRIDAKVVKREDDSRANSSLISITYKDGIYCMSLELISDKSTVDELRIDAEVEDKFLIYGNQANHDNSKSGERNGAFNGTKYIELLVVNDNKLFTNYFRSDERALRAFNRQLADDMNSAFRKVGINVVLIAVVIWDQPHEVERASNISHMLHLFESYARKELYPKYKFDVAQLLTGEQVRSGHTML